MSETLNKHKNSIKILHIPLSSDFWQLVREQGLVSQVTRICTEALEDAVCQR